jgi:hypothetical protein
VIKREQIDSLVSADDDKDDDDRIYEESMRSKTFLLKLDIRILNFEPIKMLSDIKANCLSNNASICSLRSNDRF